jgi:hypothetical protein
LKDEHREVAGLLCRWCALGLAWAGAGAAAYLSAAPLGAARGQPPRVILTDAACYAAPEAYLKGLLLPPPPDTRGAVLLVRYPDRLAAFGLDESQPFYVSVKNPLPGDCPLRVIGLPQVLPLYAGDAAVLRVLAPGVRACLVDAALAARFRSAGPARWAAFRAACRRLGEVVYLHPGPPGEFEAFRRDLHREGLAEPVYCHLEGDDGAVAALYGQREALARRGQAPPPVLVTDSEELAARAAAWGLDARWIAPPGAKPARPHDRLRYHEGLEGFLRDAAAEEPKGD